MIEERNIESKLKEIMAKIFTVPVSDIKEDSSPHTIASWDSLKHLDMVLALEKEFGIRFNDEEIPTMISYKMVLITVQAYLE
jgi:acyl carrier protein